MSERTKNLAILGLIVGMFIAFALVGRFLIHPDNMDKTNRGTLIVPHIQLDALEVQDMAGEPWTAEQAEGKWSLFYVAGRECHQACKNALFYLMQRLRESLGRDRERVRLVLLHTAEPSTALTDFIQEKLHDLTQLRADRTTVVEALAPAFPDSQDSPLHHLYLMAPDGQIFMWYPTHAEQAPLLREAENIYKDLTRTLKGSLIG
jgi:cytochrome oxidase Cu insertion factor (SCO1/SenC/PrrC family)